MVSESGSVIYYPNFRPSTAWLKRALLFWDRVRCIVPPEAERFIPRGGEYRALEEADCLKNTDPQPYLEGAGDTFMFAIHGGFLDDDNAIQQFTRTLRYARGSGGHQAQLLARESRFQEFCMHFRKMRYDVIRELERTGIGRRTCDGEWIQASGAIAGIYMLCLADAVGRGTKAPIGTAYPEFHRLGERLRLRDSRRTGAAEYALMRLGIAFPSEMVMRHKSVDWLLRFREKYGVLRQSFREKVMAIARDVSSLTDENERDDLLHSVRLEKEAAHSEYLRRLRETRIISCNSLLTIGVPSLIPATAAALGAPPVAVVVAGAAAVTLGVAALYSASSRESRDAAHSNPWNYAACVGRAVGRLRRRTIRK